MSVTCPEHRDRDLVARQWHFFFFFHHQTTEPAPLASLTLLERTETDGAAWACRGLRHARRLRPGGVGREGLPGSLSPAVVAPCGNRTNAVGGQDGPVDLPAGLRQSGDR